MTVKITVDPIVYIGGPHLVPLDFFGGTHGHFLEYVINSYIFRGPRIDNLFTPLGTAHNASVDAEYRINRRVSAAHYSEMSLPWPSLDPEKVIRITVAGFKGHVCYQINLSSRAGDITISEKELAIPEEARTVPSRLRNQYYCKFASLELDAEIPSNWRRDSTGQLFEFPMTACYDLLEFLSTLRNLATFLNHTFNPDTTLVALWQQFIDKNQGLQSWYRCINMLDKVSNNQDFNVELSIHEQGLLNLMLTNSFGVCDGPLFDNDQYPTNAQEIWSHIKHYIDTFDNRFSNCNKV